MNRFLIVRRTDSGQTTFNVEQTSFTHQATKINNNCCEWTLWVLETQKLIKLIVAASGITESGMRWAHGRVFAHTDTRRVRAAISQQSDIVRFLIKVTKTIHGHTSQQRYARSVFAVRSWYFQRSTRVGRCLATRAPTRCTTTPPPMNRREGAMT